MIVNENDALHYVGGSQINAVVSSVKCVPVISVDLIFNVLL